MTAVLSNASFASYPLAIDSFVDELQLTKRQTALNSEGGVCKYFLKGECLRDKSCPFKHTRVAQNLVCKHYLRGLCKKGDYCEFLHVYDLSRMPTCQFFLAYGECGNPDCNFLHVRSSETQGECEDYAHGFCEKGQRCTQQHHRAELCADYLTGFCPLGPLCTKAHPKWEADGGAERRRLAAKKRELEGGTEQRQTTDEDNTPGRGYFTQRVSYRQSAPTKVVQPLSSITCNRCHEQGHFAAQCPTLGGDESQQHKIRKLEDVQCFRCGEKGHYANVCQNPRKAPPPQGYQVPGRQGGFDRGERRERY